MRVILFILVLFPTMASADKERVQFYAPPALIESGLIKYIKPRFSLKTQIGVDIVSDPAAADVLIWDKGRPLFTGLDSVWRLDIKSDDQHAQKFVDWLKSDIGKRTIFNFAPAGTPLFFEPKVEQTEAAETVDTQQAALGRKISFQRCGRCHVTEPDRKMVSIGSAPSFAVLRSLKDWESRFAAFYVLNPHPAFTQVEDLTDPFPNDRPSPIRPIELSLDDLDAILAYTQAMEPADLGKPLEHQ